MSVHPVDDEARAYGRAFFEDTVEVQAAVQRMFRSASDAAQFDWHHPELARLERRVGEAPGL